MTNISSLNNGVRIAIFVIAALACLTPWVPAPVALLLGFVLSQTTGHPFEEFNQSWIKILLPVSIVGLGFGMNVHEAFKAGKSGLLFSVASIAVTLVVGMIAGKFLKINKITTLLIASGTAVCGGSAIAAVSKVVEADKNEMSVSLATVFILNSLALFIFPVVGTYFHLTQSQFGVWAALAIHDTSSVVAAAHKYGAEALQIATTIKLERVLWLIPLSLIIALAYKKGTRSVKIPWFILFFVAAMLLNTFVPSFAATGEVLVAIAKKGLTLTLFLVGTGLTKNALKSVGIRPFVLGLLLWIFISDASLLVIMHAIL